MVRERRLALPAAANGQEIHAMADEALDPRPAIVPGWNRHHESLDPRGAHERFESGEQCNEQRAALLGPTAFTSR